MFEFFLNLFQENDEILECLKSGRPEMQYSPVIREFSLGLKFHSTAAYEFVRSKFNNNLPTVRSIQKWCESVDGSPGISTDALESIQKKAVLYANENGDKEMPVCLISDEMSVKKNVSWNRNVREFSGFAEYVNKSTSDAAELDNKLPLANNALVFMIVGRDFKIPVAYYLLAGLDATTRAALTIEVIKGVNETGARIMTLTSDGLAANVTVANLLGADFKNNQPYFTSPTNENHKIYVIWDAPHLIKIARGRFATKSLFHNEKPLKWELIVLLHNLQKTRNINLGNKLSDLHVNFQSKKMNVRIAAQTISNSVADCLKQLSEDGEVGFEEVEEEAEYMRTIRNLFDIMNYKERSQNSNNSFKQPICQSTAEEFFKYFDQATNYLENIEIETECNGKLVRKPLLKSQSFMTAFGFINNMTSIKGIYQDFVESGLLDEIITFQFSQDHLETWFSTVRRALGSNDNPSAFEFKYIFRKLLICHQFVYNGLKSNCHIDNIPVLTVPVKHVRNMKPNIAHVLAVDIDFDYESAINQSLSCFDDHLVSYIASAVENEIISKIRYFTKTQCPGCLPVFSENIKVNTTHIIKAADVIMEKLAISGGSGYSQTMKTVFVNLNIDELFSKTDFEGHNHETSGAYTHKEQFLLEIIDTYMNMKSHNIGDRITEERRGEYIRHTSRKNVHFAGQ